MNQTTPHVQELPNGPGPGTEMPPPPVAAVAQVYRFPLGALVTCHVCGQALTGLNQPIVMELKDDRPLVSHTVCYEQRWGGELAARRSFVPAELYTGMEAKDQAKVRQIIDSAQDLKSVMLAAPRMRCTALLSQDFSTATYTVHPTDKYLEVCKNTALPYLPFAYWSDAYTILMLRNELVPRFPETAQAALEALPRSNGGLHWWSWIESGHALDRALYLVVRNQYATVLKIPEASYSDLYKEQTEAVALHKLTEQFVGLLTDRLKVYGISASISAKPWIHRTHLYKIDDQALALAVNLQYDSFLLKDGTTPVSIVFSSQGARAYLVERPPLPAPQLHTLYVIQGIEEKKYVAHMGGIPL